VRERELFFTRESVLSRHVLAGSSLLCAGVFVREKVCE